MGNKEGTSNFVAQIFHLLYRRFLIGRDLNYHDGQRFKKPRYSRLEVCATALAPDCKPQLCLSAALLVVLLFGCASPPPHRAFSPAQDLPAEAMITQRAVLSVLGRQYTLNGYLARSQTRGLRLTVTENFGNVLADVLVKPDGSVLVMRSSRAFRPAWIQKYIASDLSCIFRDAPGADCPGEKLSETHYLIKRRWYKLDLQIVQVKPGPQKAELFDAP